MVLTGFSDVEAIIDAIKTGKVYKYMTKPWDKEILKLIIDDAITALEKRLVGKRTMQELEQKNARQEARITELEKELKKYSGMK